MFQKRNENHQVDRRVPSSKIYASVSPKRETAGEAIKFEYITQPRRERERERERLVENARRARVFICRESALLFVRVARGNESQFAAGVRRYCSGLEFERTRQKRC